VHDNIFEWHVTLLGAKESFNVIPEMLRMTFLHKILHKIFNLHIWKKRLRPPVLQQVEPVHDNIVEWHVTLLGAKGPLDVSAKNTAQDFHFFLVFFLKKNSKPETLQQVELVHDNIFE